MVQELTVASRRVGAAMFIDLHGDVTMDAETALPPAFQQAVATGGQRVALNLAGCEYISSGGIAVITHLLNQARQGGIILVICGLNTHYQKIFQMMGLAQYCWDPPESGDFTGYPTMPR